MKIYSRLSSAAIVIGALVNTRIILKIVTLKIITKTVLKIRHVPVVSLALFTLNIHTIKNFIQYAVL